MNFKLPPPRQQLLGLLATRVDEVLKTGDQQWANQLATMLERHALVLRAAVGGKATWAKAYRGGCPCPDEAAARLAAAVHATQWPHATDEDIRDAVRASSESARWALAWAVEQRREKREVATVRVGGNLYDLLVYSHERR